MCATETTIGRMKIGDKLLFGAYGVSNDDPHPILWLKGTPNGDFITQDILDYIAFDARERSSEVHNRRSWGNPSYPLSNILSFLNSANPQWWFATHPTDAPPDNSGYNLMDSRLEYVSHFGFLYHFEDYETSAIVTQEIAADGVTVQTLVRLPTYSDILGTEKFKLFHKKGVRTHGTSDFFDRRGVRLGFSHESFIEFWVSDQSPQDTATVISRSATFQRQYPYCGSGLRPVCTLNLDTIVELGDDGTFHIKPSEANRKVFTDEELMALLGMARP